MSEQVKQKDHAGRERVSDGERERERESAQWKSWRGAHGFQEKDTLRYCLSDNLFISQNLEKYRLQSSAEALVGSMVKKETKSHKKEWKKHGVEVQKNLHLKCLAEHIDPCLAHSSYCAFLSYWAV